jgi:hypothetical protein
MPSKDSTWSKLSDSGRDSEPRTKVRQSDEDNSVQRADRYESTGDGGHTHDGYNHDTMSGEHREYSGGENSDDRTYNQK